MSYEDDQIELWVNSSLVTSISFSDDFDNSDGFAYFSIFTKFGLDVEHGFFIKNNNIEKIAGELELLATKLREKRRWKPKRKISSK